MDEQVLSLKDSLRVVLRSRRIVVVLMVVGLVLGIGYAVAVPALVSAKTLVLLPPAPVSASSVPTRSVQTEIAIATSPGILNPAAAAAGVSLPFGTLQRRVSISGLTDDVIQIVAKASNASQAKSLANSVAETFVTYLSSQAAQLDNGAVLEFKQESAALNEEIAGYQDQVKTTNQVLKSDVPGSPKATSDRALYLTQSAALDDANQQLKIVNTRAAEVEIQGNSGAAILQRATSAITPSVLRFPELGVIGLLGGLLVGICVAFGIGRRDRRLHKRDEIARAAGAPVLASLTANRRAKSEDLLQILDNFRPSVSDKANLRRLLDELGVQKHGARSDLATSQNGTGQNGSSGQNSSSVHHTTIEVSAIVLAGDEKAVVAITELPAFAAGLGLPVALVVEGSTTSTQQLAIACAARDPLDLGAPRPNLLTYASTPDKAPEGASLTVTIEVVDPATLDVADEPLVDSSPDRQRRALLVVSSGFAKPEDLEVVALASEHHGRPLAGVVVADAERSDKTSGQQQPRRVMGLHGPRQLSALRSSTR